jgi:hypothetical protein
MWALIDWTYQIWLLYQFQSMKTTVFWDIVLCSLVEVYWRFRGACCLHHQGSIVLCIIFIFMFWCSAIWNLVILSSFLLLKFISFFIFMLKMTIVYIYSYLNSNLICCVWFWFAIFYSVEVTFDRCKQCLVVFPKGLQ